MRYSPKPIKAYNREIGGKQYGPSESEMLTLDPEAWNLAFLSFAYEKRPVHTDPNFTVLVRRTAMAHAEVAGGQAQPVRKLLSKPAPAFVKIIESSPSLHQLPLYIAYGDAWVETMRERSRLCVTEEPVPDDVTQTDAARALLQGIARKP